MDWSPPGSSVHGILQAGILEWVAITSSRGSSPPRDQTHAPALRVQSRSPCCCLIAKSCLTLVTPWTVAHQAPLSMGFPRQENWNGWPFPSPGDLSDPGIELLSPVLEGDILSTGQPENLFETICLAYVLEEEEIFSFYQSLWEEMESILL